MSGCDHKFLGSNTCIRCGVHVDTLKAEARAELAKLQREPMRIKGEISGDSVEITFNDIVRQVALDWRAVGLVRLYVRVPGAGHELCVCELREGEALRIRSEIIDPPPVTKLDVEVHSIDDGDGEPQ